MHGDEAGWQLEAYQDGTPGCAGLVLLSPWTLPHQAKSRRNTLRKLRCSPRVLRLDCGMNSFANLPLS